ncbi:MAG: ABC transporter substrate-binding protein [Thermoanaerobaculia bacterium]|nr:ABC transporter substrate-binding protein [Thermoanaerobaculia bacterium]
MRRHRSAPARTAALLLAACWIAACAASGPTWPTDDSLTIALESAPINLDPRIGTDQASARVCELVLSGLVRKDPNGNLLPDLAQRWEILDDGLRYRFHLTENIAFHDGEPLAAEDVAWTYQSLVDGTVTSAKRGAFQMVERVEAVDELVVDFVLSRPHGALLADLTSEQGVIRAGTTPQESNALLVGTGPFRFVRRTPETVTLEPNEGYRRGAPRLDRVVLREIPDSTVRALELRKGSVQLIVNGLTPDQVPSFRDDPAYRVVATPGSNYVYLGLNLDDPILAVREVRRAMAMAIDREQLVETLRRGLARVTETMMPEGHWAWDEELESIPYDVDGARRLLDEAGFPDPDGDGPEPRFTLTYKTSTNEESLLQAQIVQSMLAEAGIGIDIRSYEFATFYTDIKQGNFQLFSLTWTGVIDPHIYNLVLHSASIPPAGANRGRYRNPEFDRLIEAGSRLSDPVARKPFYVEAQRILADDLPYISLYHKVNVAVMAAELEGYRNYLSGELYSVAEMYWKR